VAVTSPDHLSLELFSHKGAGTLIKRGEPVLVLTSFDDPALDLPRLKALLEEAFKATLPDSYFESLAPRLKRIYLCESYRGVAIVTAEPAGAETTAEVAPGVYRHYMTGPGRQELPYLDKFAVSPSAQGDKLGEMLWNKMEEHEETLFWRSKSSNRVNSWYFEHADGAYKTPKWTVFWRGLNDNLIMGCVRYALKAPPTFSDKTL
jgi:acetylglutamate synthase